MTFTLPKSACTVQRGGGGRDIKEFTLRTRRLRSGSVLTRLRFDLGAVAALVTLSDEILHHGQNSIYIHLLSRSKLCAWYIALHCLGH